MYTLYKRNTRNINRFGKRAFHGIQRTCQRTCSRTFSFHRPLLLYHYHRWKRWGGGGGRWGRGKKGVVFQFQGQRMGGRSVELDN